jgi:3-dehydroquinate synthetase
MPRAIFFRPNFTSDTELVSSLQNDSSKNLLIYDSNLPDNMVSKVYKSFKACEIFAIPSGESSKNWETLELIIN